MDRIELMRAEKRALSDDRRALHARAVKEDREFTADEQARWDKLGADIERLTTMIGESENEPRPLTNAASPLGAGASYATTSTGVQTCLANVGQADAVTKLYGPWAQRARDILAITNEEHQPIATGDFTSAGEFLAAVAKEAMGGKKDERLAALHTTRAPKQFSLIGSGYLVPTSHQIELMSRVVSFDNLPLTSQCLRYPMISRNHEFPVITGYDQSGGPIGDMVFNAVPEGDTIDEGSVKTESIPLNAHKYACLLKVPLEVVQDAGDTTFQIISDFVVRQMAWSVEKHAIYGVGGIVGCLNHDSIYEQAAEVGQAASTVIAENCDNMESHVQSLWENEYIWMANRGTMKQLRELNAVGGVASLFKGVGLAPGTGVGAPQYMPDGRRIYFNRLLPALGTTGDIVLCRPGAYVLGTRLGATVEADRSFEFNKYNLTLRYVMRMAGRPIHRTVTTEYDGSSSSAFIQLATRS